MSTKKRPFIFRIHAAEFFAEVSKLNQKQRSCFLTNFATDLITLNPNSEYSRKVISETIGFIEKQHDNGSKGGRPKKTQCKPNDNPTVTQNKPNRKVEEEEEVKTIKEKTYSQDFLSFWSEYPKKEKKDPAWKAWQKLKPTLTEVLQALRWQKQSDQWQKENGQYIPNPEAYLNQGRWKDEKPVVQERLIY